MESTFKLSRRHLPTEPSPLVHPFFHLVHAESRVFEARRTVRADESSNLASNLRQVYASETRLDAGITGFRDAPSSKRLNYQDLCSSFRLSSILPKQGRTRDAELPTGSIKAFGAARYDGGTSNDTSHSVAPIIDYRANDCLKSRIRADSRYCATRSPSFQ